VLDPKIYEAIGRVAVAATSLQYGAAYCAALGLDEDDEWMRATLERPGTHVQDALRMLAGLVGDSDTVLQQRLVEFADDITTRLRERNKIMHSVVMLASDGEMVETWSWHPRSDSEGPIDIEAMKELELRLGGLGGRSGVLQHECTLGARSRISRTLRGQRAVRHDVYAGQTARKVSQTNLRMMSAFPRRCRLLFILTSAASGTHRSASTGSMSKQPRRHRCRSR
jgi:hypothetical protein